MFLTKRSQGQRRVTLQVSSYSSERTQSFVQCGGEAGPPFNIIFSLQAYLAELERQ